MNRRAVRTIGHDIDLSGWLKEFDDLPQPWDDVALFGRAAPLVVELGSGKGLFLTGAAAAHPECNLLGLEMALRYAKLAASKLGQRNLTNARMVHGDGLRVFRERLPTAGVQAIHVYFPDPWWKARHKKRRVLNEAFLADAERTLVPGGALHFWTDVEEYFQTTLEMIARCSRLEGPLPVVESAAEHDLDYRTHFERRTRLAGLPVFRSEFRKALK
ncbi:MAG: tRNA (guanosine(46)-N7)-methyltransferase TrmB [Planctomycetes bacterium]|nr:tRNA (guanosine(46)-N7)-methyltransferase TrmB [Planctomycetota bacterium]